MRPLTIIPDDSPLQQQSRHAELSERGWELSPGGMDAPPLGSEDYWQMALIDFPTQLLDSTARPKRGDTQRPPFVLITVDKRSRLLSYESHYVAKEPELARTVRAAVVHVLPRSGQAQAEPLLSKLTLVESQDQKFYDSEEPDAISVAAHNYRQRRRQDILAELIELKDCR